MHVFGILHPYQVTLFVAKLVKFVWKGSEKQGRGDVENKKHIAINWPI